MKKTIFIAGVIVIFCITWGLGDWRVLLVAALVVIWLRYRYENTCPDEPDPYKGSLRLSDFEYKLGDRKYDEEYICRLLKRQSIRNLCYLQIGIQRRISEWKMSGMTLMSLREEQIVDKQINYYTYLLKLTNECRYNKEK